MSPIEARLRELLERRILILDGAMGTMIQRYRLDEAGFRGARFADLAHDVKGNNELLSLSQPQLVTEIHEQFLAAGADLIETNTFGATAIAQADYRLAHLAREMNLASARLARAACDRVATPQRPRFVVGAIGPTPKTASMSPDVNDPGARNVSFDELRDAYGEQVRALVDGGVDLLLLETIFDTLNAKAAVFAIDALMAEREAAGLPRLPLMVSGTVTDASGRILSGQTVEAFWNSLRHARPLTVGLNCALGAALMRPYIEELSTRADTLHLRVPERRSAEPDVRHRLRRDARGHRGAARRVRARRFRQHRRRLLRHHARAHRGDRAGARRRGAAPRARAAARAAPVRSRAVHHRRRARCSSTSASAPTSPARRPSRA